MGSGSSRQAPPAPEPLPIEVVDNHLHLDHARHGEVRADVADTIAAATAVGVPRMVQIGCDLPGARETIELIDTYAALLGGVSLHPNEIARFSDAAALADGLAEIEQLAAHPRVRVVGETGLDYFRTGPDGRPAQQEAFRWHIDLAKRLGKTLQIHDRDAHDDALRILDEQGAPERTVLHCFSGDVAMAHRAVDAGYHLSFAGTVTFTNAKGLREALSVVPLDRLLVETDAPYLTPHPWRGARNSPYLVPVTVRTMAAVLGVAVPTLCQAITENSERLYGPW